jgi:aminoglycoside phosphotransferase (APT) family kinase protein
VIAATAERCETRDGVGTVLDPRVMAARLGGSAPCHVLDAKLDPGGRGVVLYRHGERLVLGVVEADGEVRVYPFPLDPGLPGLATAFDSDAMRPVLARALTGDRSSQRGRVVTYRSELIRYRPMRRCTLRLELGMADRARPGVLRRRELYAKLYHDAEKAAAAHAAQTMVSAANSAREVVFARPAGHAPELNMVLQEPLSGTPVEPLLGVDDGAASTATAAAVAALHDLEVTDARMRPIEPAVVRMRARADAVSQLDRPLGAAMAKVADRLLHMLGRLDHWGATVCLVHGDCKPSQFLIGPAGVSVLDLDHCGMADPASDVGAYMAGLRAREARRPARAGSRLHTARARRRFLDAYVARRGDDGLVLRVRWYEAAALLRKAYRAFQRSPSSRLAPALVAAADRALDALPPAGGMR